LGYGTGPIIRHRQGRRSKGRQGFNQGESLMAKTAKKEAFDKKVAAKAMKLMKEGKPRKQAFAIAYGMVGSSRKS
tara:strand:+ start:1000 stop:1224 length:225 start_codon:yes stop_codon:yes gene_type:complete